MPTLLFRPLRRVAIRQWFLGNPCAFWSPQLPVCWIVNVWSRVLDGMMGLIWSRSPSELCHDGVKVPMQSG